MFVSLALPAAPDLAPLPPYPFTSPSPLPNKVLYLPASFSDSSSLAPSGPGSCSPLSPVSLLYSTLDLSHHRHCWSIQPSPMGLRPEYPTNPRSVSLCTVRSLKCNMLQTGHLPQAHSSSRVTFQRGHCHLPTPGPDTQESALTSHFSLCFYPLSFRCFDL